MKATLNNAPKNNARNYSEAKELMTRYVVVAGKRNIIDIRTWTSRHSDGAAPLYAAVWIQSLEHSASGAGKATGGGYCKTSAAMTEALNNAGVHLDTETSGRGTSAIIEALHAIADALGYPDHHIVE